MKIAICVVCYNRPNSLKRILSSLEKAYYEESATLIISIDKSDTKAVEDLAERYIWPYGELRVVKHSENLGLRKHILSIGDYLNEFEAVIVLEDDIFVAPSFYLYAKACVEKFYDNPEIAGISLFNFPLDYQCGLPFMPMYSDSDVFFVKSAVSWGQVWMRNQWFAFKTWYETHNEEFSMLPHLPESVCAWKHTSWLKYHIRYCIEQDKKFVYPYASYSTCFCDVGTHAVKKQTHTQSMMMFGEKRVFKLNPTITYDGFFEAVAIYKHLNLSEEELCIDLFGQKKNRMNRRYWLTRQQLPYHIVRSFGLDFKPWEMNVLQNLEGHEIFLYDTTINSSAPSYKNNRINADFYLYRTYLDWRINLWKDIKNVLRRIKCALK